MKVGILPQKLVSLHSTVSKKTSHFDQQTVRPRRKNCTKKFICSQTECALVAVNVLASFALQEIRDDATNAKYVSYMTNTSNNKNLKSVPLLFRHFTIQKSGSYNILIKSS